MIIVYGRGTVRAKSPGANILALCKAAFPHAETVAYEDLAGLRLQGHSVLHFGTHPFAGGNAHRHAAAAFSLCKRLIQISDDYRYGPPSGVAHAVMGKDNAIVSHIGNLLANFGLQARWSWAKQLIHLPHLNAASFVDLGHGGDMGREPGLLFYGRYRDDCYNDYVTYLADAPYPVLLSPPSLGSFDTDWPGVFGERTSDIHIVNVNRGPGGRGLDLRRFEATLMLPHLEAEYRGVSNSLPNRFYEALGSRVALAVSPKALPMFDRAGMYVQPNWIVSTQNDVLTVLVFAREFAQEQYWSWRPDLVYQRLVCEFHTRVALIAGPEADGL